METNSTPDKDIQGILKKVDEQIGGAVRALGGDIQGGCCPLCYESPVRCSKPDCANCHAPSAGWEERFDEVFFREMYQDDGYSEERAVLKNFIRELLASEIAKTCAAIREKLSNEVLWEWPREILTTMDEAKKDEYREAVREAALRAVDEA